MKPSALALVVLAALGWAGTALAHDCDDTTIGSFSCCSPPVHWRGRHDTRDARLAITTEDGDATLLITGNVVAVQLSDKAMKHMQRKFRDSEDEDSDNPLSQSIKEVVFTAVRSMLDHSAECRIRDIKDVTYEHGRLILTSRDDGTVFANFDVDNDDVMRGFSERDARAFVREFDRVKASQR